MGRMATFWRDTPVAYGYIIDRGDTPPAEPVVKESGQTIVKEHTHHYADVCQQSNVVLFHHKTKDGGTKAVTISQFMLTLILLLGVAGFILLLILLLIGTGLLQPGISGAVAALLW
jgi:hypothetical protein